MQTWVDGIIVSVLAIAASVVVGVLGYWADKSGEEQRGHK